MIAYPSTRYRCEHCGKTSGSAPHMKRHEKTCTANPTRAECGMCKAALQSPPTVSALVAAIGKGDKAGLDEVTALAGGCPACILTAIRQSRVQTTYNGDDDPGFRVDFNFEGAKTAWWAEINSRDDV